MGTTPFILGIAGGACSGKTTLSKQLLKSLRFMGQIISLDDYYLTDRSSGPFTQSDSAGKIFFDMNNPSSIDWSRLNDEISRLKISDIELIIIEGMFTLHQIDIYSGMDLRIFIDYPADLRIARKIIRNFAIKNADPQITITNYSNSGRPGYEKYINPTLLNADFIIRGETIETDGIRIMGFIENIISNHQMK